MRQPSDQCPTCGRPQFDASTKLTDRELDALSAWWHFGSTANAARLLSLGEQRVKNLLQSARQRASVHTTHELVALYLGQLRTKSELLGSHKSRTEEVA